MGGGSLFHKKAFLHNARNRRQHNARRAAPIGNVAGGVVARLPQSVGNVTFNPDNCTFFSHHPFYKLPIPVAELNEDRRGFRPFPNTYWNAPKADAERYFVKPLGIRGDENGFVWILNMAEMPTMMPKLVGWNTKANRIERMCPLAKPAVSDVSRLYDFVVDIVHNFYHITDEGTGNMSDGSRAPLVVLDGRTVLDGKTTDIKSVVISDTTPF